MDFKFVTFLEDCEFAESFMDDDDTNTEPAIGDIVSLASGSPDMTVISLCDCGTAEVAWYDDNGMNIDVFPIAALILEDAE